MRLIFGPISPLSCEIQKSPQGNNWLKLAKRKDCRTPSDVIKCSAHRALHPTETTILKNRQPLWIVALLLMAALARPISAMPIDPGDPGHGSGPAPTATSAPAPTAVPEPTATITPVQLPAAGEPAAAPAATATPANTANTPGFNCHLIGGNNDTDGDGLTDASEIGHTDPCAIDSDSDGYFDGYEISQGSDPIQGCSTPIANTCGASQTGYSTSISVDNGTSIDTCEVNSTDITITGGVNTNYPGAVQIRWTSDMGSGLWTLGADHRFTFDVVWPGRSYTENAHYIDITAIGGISEQLPLGSVQVGISGSLNCGDPTTGQDTIPTAAPHRGPGGY